MKELVKCTYFTQRKDIKVRASRNPARNSPVCSRKLYEAYERYISLYKHALVLGVNHQGLHVAVEHITLSFTSRLHSRTFQELQHSSLQLWRSISTELQYLSEEIQHQIYFLITDSDVHTGPKAVALVRESKQLLLSAVETQELCT